MSNANIMFNHCVSKTEGVIQSNIPMTEIETKINGNKGQLGKAATKKTVSREAARQDPPGESIQHYYIANDKNKKSRMLEGSGRTIIIDHSGRTLVLEKSSRMVAAPMPLEHTIRPSISYEVATWSIYLAFTALAIADRFVWNVWPRQTFSIDGGSAGSDRTEGYKPGPWSVVTYDVLARISGRFAICCFNLLLVTRLQFFEHYLPASFIGRYVLDCSNIVKANIRLHRWNAIALCVLTLIHVWSILFPCVTHGYSAQVIPGTFEYPLSERAPKGFKDANPETQTMSLQVDDVFRLVEMTILLGVLTPLSVRWLARRWHIGIHIHRFVSVVYFVDIVRRHTHPHSWVLNTPVFVLWLLDKAWSAFNKRNYSPTVTRLRLSQDYILLRWKHKDQGAEASSDGIGRDYYLRLKKSSFLETAHIFTTFKNRSGFPLFGDNEDWSVACIIRVFRKKRVPQIGFKDPHSHTLRMLKASSLTMTAWGPKQGEMSGLVKNQLLNPGCKDLILVGSGAGVNYILDALQWLAGNRPACMSLKMLFSTRDVDLFDWVKSTTKALIPHDQQDGKLQVLLALTASASKEVDVESPDSQVVCTVSGRIDFFHMIPRGALVFCQGSSTLRQTVCSICKVQKAKFVGGIGGW